MDWSLCFHVAYFNKNKSNKKLAMAYLLMSVQIFHRCKETGRSWHLEESCEMKGKVLLQTSMSDSRTKEQFVAPFCQVP